MPRFVLLAHDWPTPHLDLLLERDGVLKAWRLPADFDPRTSATAEAVADHRVHYLDYEGPVSDGRGDVARRDAGGLTWELVEDGRAVVALAGARLFGRWELLRLEGTRWAFHPSGEPSRSPGR